jgi:succinoglycan biosynthesis protein ExoM
MAGRSSDSAVAASSSKPKIDVCVATYKRPELLKKLLLSLSAQETGDEFSFAVAVADNDAQRSAEAVVREFEAAGCKISYVVEPEQNISLARNKSLSLAAGDYIATIDDDIHADPQWLLNLYRALTTYHADVVHGPVVPEFHAKTPKYITQSNVFVRPNPPSGSSGNHVFTAANSLFRRKLIDGTPAPFDPRFGRTGGEDTAFFENLRKRGCKLVWCREARVCTVLSSRKTNWRWILQREFRIGNGFCEVFERGPIDPELPRAAEVRILVRRLAKTCVPVPLYLLRGLFDVRYAVKAIETSRHVAFNAGLLAYFLGFQYEEFRGR